MELMQTLEALVEFQKRFTGEFRICAVHIIDNNKLQVKFEVIILHVGLDVFQNREVIIVKEEDGSIPYKMLVHKFENETT